MFFFPRKSNFNLLCFSTKDVKFLFVMIRYQGYQFLICYVFVPRTSNFYSLGFHTKVLICYVSYQEYEFLISYGFIPRMSNFYLLRFHTEDVKFQIVMFLYQGCPNLILTFSYTKNTKF